MKRITFYFDPISPFAWLAFQRLPQVLMGDDTSPGLSYQVAYKPVLFAALLKHHGQLGPAEIPHKRDWTYRHVQWLGHSLGVPLAMPAAHPFNPLPLLRLALACATPDAPGQTNRYVTEQVLRHVWEGGADAVAPDRLAALQATLASHMAQRGRELADPAGDAVKQQLRANTDEALSAGAFGVPTCVVDGKLFWGLDGLPMLKACLQGDAWFDGPSWNGVAEVPVGTRRSA
jgi:2-hydroxychromene-2-carboxylate isomerase